MSLTGAQREREWQKITNSTQVTRNTGPSWTFLERLHMLLGFWGTSFLYPIHLGIDHQQLLCHQQRIGIWDPLAQLSAPRTQLTAGPFPSLTLLLSLSSFFPFPPKLFLPRETSTPLRTGWE